MFLDQGIGADKQRLAFRRQLQGVRAPVGERDRTLEQPAAFQAVQQRHQPGPDDAENPRQRHPGKTGILADQR